MVTYAATLDTRAAAELIHAELVANRISELGEEVPSDPAEWKQCRTSGSLGPVKHLTLRSALETALEFKSRAVENHDGLAKKALELGDYVTCNLTSTILADEVKDEQLTEDVLKSLEVK